LRRSRRNCELWEDRQMEILGCQITQIKWKPVKKKECWKTYNKMDASKGIIMKIKQTIYH
jgi:hypothetical protein